MDEQKGLNEIIQTFLVEELKEKFGAQYDRLKMYKNVDIFEKKSPILVEKFDTLIDNVESKLDASVKKIQSKNELNEDFCMTDETIDVLLKIRNSLNQIEKTNEKIIKTTAVNELMAKEKDDQKRTLELLENEQLMTDIFCSKPPNQAQ